MFKESNREGRFSLASLYESGNGIESSRSVELGGYSVVLKNQGLDSRFESYPDRHVPSASKGVEGFYSEMQRAPK